MTFNVVVDVAIRPVVPSVLALEPPEASVNVSTPAIVRVVAPARVTFASATVAASALPVTLL